MTCALTRTGHKSIEDISGTNDSAGRHRRDGELHPAVQAALPPTNARGLGSAVPPQHCAEPWALSRHLDDWEKRNTPRTCRPRNEDWRGNLQKAMKEIDPEGGIAANMGGVPRAACPNCSQTIPRLYALAGMNPPANVIARGYQNQERTGLLTRTSTPAKGFQSDRINRQASTFGTAESRSSRQNVRLQSGLGAWNYD